jgi:hypothetical protein
MTLFSSSDIGDVKFLGSLNAVEESNSPEFLIVKAPRILRRPRRLGGMSLDN